MSASVEKLKEARALIARDGGWTQGHSARDVNGNPVSSHDAQASCWCALGACQAVGAGPFYLYEAVAVPGGLAAWNDNPDRTQAEVVSMYDKAIALAEAVKA